MEGETGGDFPDWELVQDAPPLPRTSESLEAIGAGADSEGMIWSDYLSLDNQGRYVNTGGKRDVSDEGSVESDDPCWIDPGLADRHGGRNSMGFWSDSGNDRSEKLEVRDVDAGTGLGAAEIFKSQASFEEMTSESEYSDFDRKGELDFPKVEKIQMDVDELDEIRTRDEDFGSSWTDPIGDLAKNPEKDINTDSGGENRSATAKENVSSDEEEEEDGKPVEDEEKKKMVWWKVPLQVLRFCVFRVSPAWSFSVAAAVMGFLFLGRRLYKLKQKTQSLHLHVTVDDKKVSQFMIRVARLNEALWVARRVPILQPPLPVAGAAITVNTWPATSMVRL